MDDRPQAPFLPIPPGEITALEHPALLKTLSRGITTLGHNVDYQAVVNPDGAQSSVPLYLRQEDPSSSPIFSLNAASHNVVLAVSVPKRTGRKRKRGSDGPWEEDPNIEKPASAVGSLSGADLSQRDARLLRRKLQDNVDSYHVQVVGLVKHTHRYRGLFDFQQTTHNSEFMTQFIEKLVPGELSKFRDFGLRPGVSVPPNVDLVPPPYFTTQPMPFAYFYSQNPFVREVSTTDGEVKLVNATARVASYGYFIRFDQEPVPTEPPADIPALVGRRKKTILAVMQKALEERPVWTRRGLVNRMCEAMDTNLSENRLKTYFAYVAYQFKGGPWRDTLVRYGVDPRKDPSMRIYQTLMFKMQHHKSGTKKPNWHSVGQANDEDAGTKATATATTNIKAKSQAIVTPVLRDRSFQERHNRENIKDKRFDWNTHIFDGRSYCDDGKIWQVCDVTCPMLSDMLANAPVRATCDMSNTGWFHMGTWAKAKAITKTKLLAIRFGRDIGNDEFSRAMAVGNETPRLGARSIQVPVPDLDLTPEEEAIVAVKSYHNQRKSWPKKRGVTFSVPVVSKQRDREAAQLQSVLGSTAPSVLSSIQEAEEQDGDEDEDEVNEDEDGEEEEDDEDDQDDEDEEDEDEDGEDGEDGGAEGSKDSRIRVKQEILDMEGS